MNCAKPKMIHHPEIISKLKVDCTASIGRTFEPWDKKKAPYGQIELDKAPDFTGLPAGAKLNIAQMQQVIDYMSSMKLAA